MSAADHHYAPNATEYIVHHLAHWQTEKQKSIVDFSIINIDTLFFSLLCLGLTLWLLRSAAKRAAGWAGKCPSIPTAPMPRRVLVPSIPTNCWRR
jgi:hypothetical protein